jgi:hypothetical protein
LLSPALTVGTQAAGTYEQAKAQANDRNTKNFLQSAMLLKGQHDDQINEQLKGAQTTEANARATALLNPPIRQREAFNVPGVGLVQIGEDGQPHVLVGPPPKEIQPPQTVSPGQGVRQPDGSYKVIIPKDRSVGEDLRAAQDDAANRAAEAWFNTDKGPDANGAANETFKALRAAHPDWQPQQIMRAVQSGTSASAQGANLQARTGKLQGSGAAFSIGPDGKFVMGPGTGAPKAAPARPAAPPTAATTPKFARPSGWDDAKWNQYLSDTGQKP